MDNSVVSGISDQSEACAHIPSSVVPSSCRYGDSASDIMIQALTGSPEMEKDLTEAKVPSAFETTVGSENPTLQESYALISDQSEKSASETLLDLVAVSDSMVRDITETIETQSKSVANELYSPFCNPNQSKSIQTADASRPPVTAINMRTDAKTMDEKVPKVVPSSGSTKRSASRTPSCYLSTASSKASSKSSSSSSSFASFGVPVCKAGLDSTRDQNSTTVTVSTCPRCGSESALDSDRSKHRPVHRSSKYSLSRRWKGMRNACRNSVSVRTSPYHNIYSGKVGRKNRARCKYRSSESSDFNQRGRRHCKASFPSKGLDRHSPCCNSASGSAKLCPICLDSKAGCPYSLTMPDDHLMSHLCDIDSWHRRRKRETLRRKERAVIIILAVFALLIFVAMGYFGTVLFLRITNIPGV